MLIRVGAAMHGCLFIDVVNLETSATLANDPLKLSNPMEGL